jgi:putative ATP-binding cassette transporter
MTGSNSSNSTKFKPSLFDRVFPKFMISFFRIAGPYWKSEEKWKARLLVLFLLILTIGQAASPVLMNIWSQKLFDSLEQHALKRFLILVGLLGLIIIANISITTLHLMTKRKLQISWRLWLTKKISEEWMTDGHHFKITHLELNHDNPDGRIAEDIRISTETAIDLFHSLFYCSLLVISFTEILWSLSGSSDLTIFGFHLYIPGHLVWVAILTALVGGAVATFLSYPLVQAVNHRQSIEANFRFGLVHARENSEAIALIRGEEREKRYLIKLLNDVGEAFMRQTRALRQITFYTSGYDIFKQAFPILIASPRYISGSLTLGGLMQTAQAFQQMESALSWPIDNLATMANWRASVERILSLYQAINRVSIKNTRQKANKIIVKQSTDHKLSYRNLSLHDLNGEKIIPAFSLEVNQGERIMLMGEATATIKFFKATAELWPWGEGMIHLPKKSQIFFIPERPYLPAGTLKAAICYPASRQDFSSEIVEDILKKLGLDHLVAHLDDHNVWTAALTIADQQKVGFARLLLHKPSWIFLEESTDSLDIETEIKLMRLLLDTIPDVTLLSVCYHKELEEFFTKKLAFVQSDDGLKLITDRRMITRIKDNKIPARRYSNMVNIALGKSSADLFE